MSNLAFDTHKFVKDLTKAGMPDTQAEALANHYASLLTDRLATKDDLLALRKDLEGQIQILRKDLEGNMTSLEERLSHKIMVTILSTQIVTIITICSVVGFLLNVT